MAKTSHDHFGRLHRFLVTTFDVSTYTGANSRECAEFVYCARTSLELCNKTSAKAWAQNNAFMTAQVTRSRESLGVAACAAYVSTRSACQATDVRQARSPLGLTCPQLTGHTCTVYGTSRD